jgi:hypothetical protein
VENFAKETLGLINLLLTGFLAAWVFYALTSYARPDKFERVIQALIFTLFTQPLSYLVQWSLLAAGGWKSVAPWTKESETLVAAVSGVVVGAVFSFYANNDKIHRVLRLVGLTRESSFPSEWFGAFLNGVTYVVLHLKDERRIYGWLMEWPSEPGKGHFQLVQTAWLIDNQEVEMTGVESVLIGAEDVKLVEFMKRSWEGNHDKKGIEPTASATA